MQRSRLLSRPTRRMRDVIISVMPPQLTRESALESSRGDSRLYCQAALESDSPRFPLLPSHLLGPLLMPHIDSATNSRQFAPIVDCRLLIAVKFSLVRCIPGHSLPIPTLPIPIPVARFNVHFLPQSDAGDLRAIAAS